MDVGIFECEGWFCVVQECIKGESDREVGTERDKKQCSFFFEAEDGIRDRLVTGVQTCALPIYHPPAN